MVIICLRINGGISSKNPLSNSPIRALSTYIIEVAYVVTSFATVQAAFNQNSLQRSC